MYAACDRWRSLSFSAFDTVSLPLRRLSVDSRPVSLASSRSRPRFRSPLRNGAEGFAVRSVAAASGFFVGSALASTAGSGCFAASRSSRRRSSSSAFSFVIRCFSSSSRFASILASSASRANAACFSASARSCCSRSRSKASVCCRRRSSSCSCALRSACLRRKSSFSDRGCCLGFGLGALCPTGRGVVRGRSADLEVRLRGGPSITTSTFGALNLPGRGRGEGRDAPGGLP